MNKNEEDVVFFDIEKSEIKAIAFEINFTLSKNNFNQNVDVDYSDNIIAIGSYKEEKKEYTNDFLIQCDDENDKKKKLNFLLNLCLKINEHKNNLDKLLFLTKNTEQK